MGADSFVDRNQAALLHDRMSGHIRRGVGSLRGREDQYAVLFGDIERSVRREADAVGDDEIDRRRERPDVVGDAVLVLVGDGPDLCCHRGPDEHDAGRWPDRHLTRAWDDRIQTDLGSGRQLDARKNRRECLRGRAGLRNDFGALLAVASCGGCPHSSAAALLAAKAMARTGIAIILNSIPSFPRWLAARARRQSGTTSRRGCHPVVRRAAV